MRRFSITTLSSLKLNCDIYPPYYGSKKKEPEQERKHEVGPQNDKKNNNNKMQGKIKQKRNKTEYELKYTLTNFSVRDVHSCLST